MYFAVQSITDKKILHLLAGARDELLHLVQIGVERFPARGSEAVFGAGDASLEKLVAAEIAGRLQFLRVHAKVAVGGLEDALEIIETQGIVDGEGADDAKTQALVNQAIEFRQLAGRTRCANGSCRSGSGRRG